MKIQFIWCWKMWEIILSSVLNNWVESKDIYVSTKTEKTQNLLGEEYDVQIWINKKADIIILGIKPQQFSEIDFEGFSGNSLIISIMAWVSNETIHSKTQNNNILKCMPNTSMSIWEWVVWYYKSKWIDESKIDFFINTFEKIWTLIEVDSEDKIDKITALSGSWPAYFYYITEILKKKALEFWFSEKESIIIADNTFIWSAKLLEQSLLTVEELRSNITSKWWTTQKAIESFEENWLDNIFKKWINSAYERAKDLNK